MLKLQDAVNRVMEVEGYIGLSHFAAKTPPKHLPSNVEAGFKEAATCFTVDCWNATGAMARMCLDLATRKLMPETKIKGLNAKTRRDLGLRLPWLFNNGKLPEEMRERSRCIREDGNDDAHSGNLKKSDAEAILDFSSLLLERLYTEPAKLELANKRRKARRK